VGDCRSDIARSAIERICHEQTPFHRWGHLARLEIVSGDLRECGRRKLTFLMICQIYIYDPPLIIVVKGVPCSRDEVLVVVRTQPIA
jgi:hypothetical protein